MKIKIQYQSGELLPEVNDADQLKLFDNKEEMNSVPLKYPRRENRKIANNQYKIDEPSERVSQTMQKVRSSATSIENLLEDELKKSGLNFSRPEQLIENIEGNPDFVIPRYRIAIFCDGDFWHGYQFDKTKIKSNNEFWSAKIERNTLRDKEVNYGLQEKEWKIFRFWEHDIKSNSKSCVDQVQAYINTTKPQEDHLFTFIDLFSGIGGFRIPLEMLGGKCLGFSEIDKQAIEVYKKNFFGFNNEEELELGDITKIEKLPFQEIDLIVGGVPCQSWSVAGKMRGFDDPRGKLWDDSIRVIKLNKPKAFIFENVKGLVDPRNKANLDLIIASFKKIGYTVKKPQLLNSYDFGLPQNRDRIFIVGVRNDLSNHIQKFNFPSAIDSKHLLTDLISEIKTDKTIIKKIFEPSEIYEGKIPMSRNRFQKIDQLNDFFIFCDTRNGHTTIHSWDIIKTSDREKEICMQILRNRRKKIYGNADGNPLSFEILKKLIPDLKKDELSKLVNKKILRIVQEKGYEFANSKNSAGINGIYRVYLPHSDIFSTLTATGTKDVIALKSIYGSNPQEYRENFINEIVKKKLFRSISAKEAGKLQGFPNWFSIDKDEKAAKKQFGNAVSTSVIYFLANELVNTEIFNLTTHDKKRKK